MPKLEKENQEEGNSNASTLEKKEALNMNKKEKLLSQAQQFRAIGNLLCIKGKTFKEKSDGAIAIGLAEVCEMLAEIIKNKEKDST